MPLTAGTRLGHYEILGPIGAGGMGEVYRARDSRLNRDVAIKSLPELVARDPERVARFTREAQTLAALNHPNIAHIYGIEGSPGAGLALVMELVEGEDLSQLIARGPQTEFRLDGVERGEHTLQARLVDRNGRTLAGSEPVTFHLWQASRLFQNRRGGR